MSEDIWSSVTVKVPKSWVNLKGKGLTDFADPAPFLEPEELEDWPRVATQLYDDGSPQAWLNGLWNQFYGCPEWQEETAGDDTIVTMSGDLNYGVTDEIEFLPKWRIPFQAHSDSKYEYGAFDYFYDGSTEGEVISAESSNEGVTMVSISDLQLLREKWAHAPAGLAAAVEELIDKLSFDLSKCDIEHLRVHPVYWAQEE